MTLLNFRKSIHLNDLLRNSLVLASLMLIFLLLKNATLGVTVKNTTLDLTLFLLILHDLPPLFKIITYNMGSRPHDLTRSKVVKEILLCESL